MEIVPKHEELTHAIAHSPTSMLAPIDQEIIKRKGIYAKEPSFGIYTMVYAVIFPNQSGFALLNALIQHGKVNPQPVLEFGQHFRLFSMLMANIE